MKTLYQKILMVLIFLSFASIFNAFSPVGVCGTTITVVSGILITGGLIFLLLSFSKKLARINKQLTTAAGGSFTTDFPEKINDEMDMLTLKLSKLFKDMKEYDQLRAKNVTKSSKASSILSFNISEPVLMADLEENILDLNPAAQKIWDLQTRKFPLDVIRKHAQNIEFNKFLKRAISENVEENKMEIYFPSSIKREVTLKAIPVKTIEGHIPLIILFVKNGDGRNGNGKNAGKLNGIQ